MSSVAGDVNATATGASAQATGVNSTATGPSSVASGANATATGTGSVASTDNTVANGAAAQAKGIGANAVGAGAKALTDGSVPSGTGAVANGVQTVSLGAGATTTGPSSVAIGAGSTDSGRADTVSVGAVGAERTISNVAPGARDTDAVNRAQLNPVYRSLEMTVDPTTGQVSSPAFSVGTRTYSTVQDALTGINADMTSGNVGLRRQDTTTLAIGVASTTRGSSVSMAGTAGNRTVTGVAPESISAASADAVNGSQLYAANQAVGANTVAIGTTNSRVTALESGLASTNNAVTALQGTVISTGQQVGVLSGNLANLTTSYNTFVQQVQSGNLSLVQRVGGAGGQVNIAATTGSAWPAPTAIARSPVLPPAPSMPLRRMRSTARSSTRPTHASLRSRPRRPSRASGSRRWSRRRSSRASG